MRLIFLYGPDGCGKTFIQKRLSSKNNDIIFVSFEPSSFGRPNGIIDTGNNGELSAENPPTSILKSLLLCVRYTIRFLLLIFRTPSESVVVCSRGPLEFGINNTHRRIPVILGRSINWLLGGESVLICRNIDSILLKKNELSRDRIIELYEEYMKYCRTMVNNNSIEALDRSLNILLGI